jgi:hypothetical protein
MSSTWAQSQRQGWLCNLYGKNHSDGTRTLPNDCVQSQLIGCLDSLLSKRSSAQDAAAETASLIMSQEDVDTPWSNLLGLYLSAAETFGEQDILVLLVEYIVKLANLPDAINEGPVERILDEGGITRRVEPGQVVVFEEGTLWRDLPRFQRELTERFQGKYRPPCSVHCIF